ncbi:FAD:protein FMN transferase [Roseateles sp. NT4]|uniref:FAD:protein FMN transferase n=1 Tax=Roseateles sp. NT4 TaxID=3453715 RepID=UPI003EEA5E11
MSWRCERRRRARPALGTLVDITIDTADPGQAHAAFEAAFAEVRRIHDLMSVHDEGSDLARLARQAHLAPVAVHADTLAVLRLALRVYALSEGVFDPSAGSGGSLADVVIGAEGRVGFRRPLKLDFGGIAKGHAVDCAIHALAKLGVAGALVNAGGDMRAFGDASHPVQLRMADGVQTVAMLKDAAMASSRADPSGSHFDARNGSAVMRDDSIVVHATSAAVADALTKVALVSTPLADRACAALDAEWRAFPYAA